MLGDPQRLQQIVWNLLSNGVKFTDAGGVVDVAVSPAGKAVRLVVRDSGSGISPEFLPFVFERFRQSDASSARRQGGLGLGLALVRELVELHGGTGPCRKRRGRSGRHPSRSIADDELTDLRRSRPVSDPQRLTQAPSLEGIRLLIVEDEMDSRELLAAKTKCGAQVVTAASCDEALDAIQRAAAAKNLPHVILSDIGMPTRDGLI